MNDNDELNGAASQPPLSESGTHSERKLLDSARSHPADDVIRQRVFARVLAGETPQRVTRARRQQLLIGMAALGLAAAATLASTLTVKHATQRAEHPALGAEPRTVSNSARPTLPQLPSGPSPCAATVVAPGVDARIDDLEDANANVLPIEGREGTWYVATDGTGSLSEPPLMHSPATAAVPEYLGGIWHPTRLSAPRGRSHYALHTRGSSFTSWGVVASARLAIGQGACYDASAYAGLEFWARGTSRVAVSAQMSDVTPTTLGGLCVRDCFNRHVHPIELGAKWQQYTIAWSEFVQQGTPSTRAFDPKRLWGIDFVLEAGSTPFELWLDDISFVQHVSNIAR